MIMSLKQLNKIPDKIDAECKRYLEGIEKGIVHRFSISIKAGKKLEVMGELDDYDMSQVNGADGLKYILNEFYEGYLGLTPKPRGLILKLSFRVDNGGTGTLFKILSKPSKLGKSASKNDLFLKEYDF